MSTQLINYAEIFYQISGFQKIDVPWVASKEIIDLTKPADRDYLMLEENVLVGSAEQSFLAMYFEGKLKAGRYVATTPCFRDEPVRDDLHRLYFMKTELIQVDNVTQKCLHEIIKTAQSFFNQFVPTKLVKLEDGSVDICSKRSNIELGSYGIRQFTLQNKTIKYIYGTGCAVPRLSQVIKIEKEIGYHQDLEIPKTRIGSVLKVFEEVQELQDAVVQKEKVLAICELADIVGAIDHYLHANQTGLSIPDLMKMSKLTQKAFQTGSR